jgi:serine/threonine-protein kinase
MDQKEQFGNYILFRKLGEDPLGETFRAGKLGRSGVERVVTLRVFNGQGIDAPRLWARLRTRLGMQQLLKSPNLGDGVDAGEIRGVPYVAYDYVSGKSLAALMAQAEKRRRPVPLDHALLIAERVAQGLVVAGDVRHADERVLHGFVVPHLVLLSSEGEIRVLGTEAGPGLREAASGPAVHQAFARYLSPEALAGEPVAKSDDVYSLGVLLYEMITNRHLPPPAATGYGPIVEQAVVASEETPLSADLTVFLKKALAAAGERWPDVPALHKALAKLMAEGAYNPTTFNLAFFMHSLFREEIERETQEIEAEKRLPVAQMTAAPAAAQASRAPAPAAPPPPAATPASDARPALREQTAVGQAPSEGPNKVLLFGGIAAAIVLVGIGLYLTLGRAKTPPESAPTTPAATAVEAGAAGQPAASPTTTEVPSPAPATASPAPAAAATQDANQALLARLVEERFKASESAMRKQYDDQIRALQRQLEDSRKVPAPSKPNPEPAATAATVPGSVAAPASPAPGLTSGTSTGSAVPVEPASVEARPAPPVPQETAAAPAPQVPVVRQGDLVTMGAGVTPPRVQNLAQPRYPAIARQTGRSASVLIRVLVDENGRPADVQLKDSKRAGLGFDEAALESARRSSYTPATKHGVRVKMWLDLNIKFSPS